MIGLAIDLGYLSNVEQYIYPLLPEFHDIEWGEEKAALTLKNLLTMRSGMSCTDGTTGGCNSQKLNQQRSWTRYTLQQEITSTPGGVFSYFTGLPVTSHTILENVTGMSVDDFSMQYLFEPLGAAEFTWSHSPSGEALSGHMLTRNMAKFGQLFLNQGQWLGHQIISADWIEESITEQVKFPNEYDGGYGYWWWLNKTTIGEYAYYAALGANGQFIFVIPTLDMVVVFTGNKDSDNPFDLLEEYILPAVN